MTHINIAKEFAESPGARYRSEGPHSGEEFLERFLVPRYLEAERNRVPLCIDLDGGTGYGAGFLEQAFGGLARLYTPKLVLDRLMLTSVEEPYLIKEIEDHISKACDPKPESNIAEPKKTPCKKCGGFKFEQRYHAIMQDIGYIDENGEFVAESSTTKDVTNGIELFECFDCSESVPIEDEDDEDEDEDV